MKTRFEVAGFCYVIFALLTAHVYLASPKAMDTGCASERLHDSQTARPVQDHQRLDGFFEDGIGPYDPNNLPEPKPVEPVVEPTGREAYTIIVWTADWCGPCKRYKTKEVPALLKAGFKVEVLDYDSDKPPKSIKSVPTVVVTWKGQILRQQSYWKAEDVIAYIDNRMSLKG